MLSTVSILFTQIILSLEHCWVPQGPRKEKFDNMRLLVRKGNGEYLLTWKSLSFKATKEACIGKSNIENDPPDGSLHYTEIVQPNSLAAVSRNLIGIPVASLL